jgi:peroxiredoxin
MVVVSISSPEETRRLIESAGLEPSTTVLFDPNHEIMQRWGIATTPGMIIVNEEMRLQRQVFGSGPGARVSGPATSVAA